jgi:glycosyltransferase involved in cell wall biosynthesis
MQRPRQSRRLRIAQLAPPVESVPPPKYGGTEQIVSVLTEELVRRGHQVSLFASADSQTGARLIPSVDCALWRHPTYRQALPFQLIALDQVYQRAAEFDIMHNHIEGLVFPLARAFRQPPVVTTLHGRLDLPEYQPFFRHFADLPLVSISDAQRAPLPGAHWVGTVHHGLDLDRFPYRAAGGEYLAFIGRIAPEKGLDTAIAVARRAGLPLRIAARLPLDQPDNAEAQRDWRYYRQVVEPLLRQPGVEYVGELAGPEKAAFLGGAAALLFPIRWPEPFGLVMIEALACGTPVLATRRGSVPEVIEDGVTGLLADDEDGLVRALARLPSLERARCRAAAEARFSAASMAAAYERIYLSLAGAEPGWTAARGVRPRAARPS